VRTVLLTLTAMLLAAAAVLTVRSFRQDTTRDSFAALVLVLGAGVPAAAYGALAA
jgi:hypothetical protein